MLLLCAALMTITIKKKSLIISGNVSDKYGTFRTISSVLLSAQLLLVGNEINKKGFEDNHKITKTTNSLLYLLSVLNSVCVMIIFIILNYFTTDG